MSAFEYLTDRVLPVALELLPPAMDTPAARALVLGICLQESRCEHRRQTHQGPARGFAQFEAGGGVRGVLTHPASSLHAKAICRLMAYEPEAVIVYYALEHNDVLAMVFARLLLWTLPDPLPEAQEYELAWGQYMAAWRPGKPHRDTWNRFYDQAWEAVI